jgi:hypothetical protein
VTNVRNKTQPNRPNIIEKYLAHYAEVPGLPETFINKSYDYVLVIPAYRENWLSLTNVWRSISNSSVLVIVIINSPVAADEATLKLKHDAMEEATSASSFQNFDFLSFSKQPDLLIVDRCNEPINEKCGVGLARKIGSDLALQLIASDKIRVPWIFSTDADAHLPADYFTKPKLINSQAAVIYPFNHKPIEGHTESCQIYEVTLLYYVAGLQFAQSGYAHSSIGSTLSINATDYAKVRGYPKRSAGEDFYLLNKLAKIAPFNTHSLPSIELSGRLSTRVPFGTGQGIKAIEAHTNPLTEHLFYHPEVFAHLRVFLSELRTCQTARNPNDYFSSSLTQQWCELSGFNKELLKHQSQSKKVFDKFVFDWFDGFRTLKYIHYLRDEKFYSVPLRRCFDDKVLPRSLIDKSLEDVIAFLRAQVFDTSV